MTEQAGYVEYGVRCPRSEAVYHVTWIRPDADRHRSLCDAHHERCQGQHEVVRHTVGPWEVCRG